jgi:Domain of unknown function (DUF4336)
MVVGSRSRPVALLTYLILILLFRRSLQLSGLTPQGSPDGEARILSRRRWIRSVVASSAAATTTASLLPSNDDDNNNNNKYARPTAARAGDVPLTAPRLSSEYYNLPYATNPDAGRFYFPTLTPPFDGRATYRYNLGRNSWAFEQLLTFANVTATIRCNVVQLNSTGGLWVHSPQWPTGEFCSLLDECGTVEHVVLPCNAFEHKAPMQAFLQKYPNSQVWVAPGQYGPLGSCGTTLLRSSSTVNVGKQSLPYRVDGILGDTNSPRPSWLNEFDMAVLYVDLPRNAGPVSEVAFCHRPTKTLISTDAVVYIPPSPPDILTTYFDVDTIRADPTFWTRSVLQAVFLPLRSETKYERSESNDYEVHYPGYDALSGRLVRAPILRAVVDARAPDAVRNWIVQQTDGTWQYDRIITSHFASPIQASPANVKASFEYLFEEDVTKLQSSESLPPIACQDWDLLDSINQFIAKTNAGEPAVFPFQRGCVE